MADNSPQTRVDRLEQNLEKLKEVVTTLVRTEVVAVEERFAKKHDSVDRALAFIMEGQEKLIEMGVQADKN